MSDDPGIMGRVIGAVVPPVVDSIDVNGIIEEVDLDELLERIDIDALLARIDINKIVSRVDINELIQEVDLNELIQDVDLNALLENVDLDELLDRIDLEALMRKAKIGDLVAESTGQVAGSALDLLRRQVVGIDVIVMRVVNGAMRRKPEDLPIGPPLLNVEPAAEDAPEEEALEVREIGAEETAELAPSEDDAA